MRMLSWSQHHLSSGVVGFANSVEMANESRSAPMIELRSNRPYINSVLPTLAVLC